MWLSSYYGWMGLGNANFQQFVPAQVGTDTNWASATASPTASHTAAIKTDGSLWVWGRNAENQLGLGLSDTTNRFAPVQVGTATDWKALSAGLYRTAAIKTDGSLWVWGQNSFGGFGLGNTTHQPSPVQVGTATDWASIIATGDGHSIAIKTDGSVWSCGNNGNGQLGLGNLTNRTTYAQVTIPSTP
jgi:alpha-tubulin suppressor-like RCC1 family protein